MTNKELTKIREEKNMTKGQFAALIGISPMMQVRYEGGKVKIPEDIAQREVFVVDPMLATGGSAVDALTMLKKRGAKKLIFMCIIAAPEGLERLKKAHPDVDIYIGALDERLNENKYIVPGLGDAGDRIFGTQ